MIYFITVLRALAACLITNAHYTGVYPTDIIANGGLIGDILFFAVSGYCLYQIRDPFAAWYGKRLVRIYPPVWLFSVVCLGLGTYSLQNHGLLWWLMYPTYYHFVASIAVLYVVYYWVIRNQVLREHLPQVMCVAAGIYLIVYTFFYDKTYYHIDVVREPMIRFLFLESMLLGAYFRQNDKKFRNRFSLRWVAAVIVAAGLYFASKIVFSRGQAYMYLQFLNQVTIFVLLYTLLRLFSGMDAMLERMPGLAKRIIEFVAAITLEIYIVQYVLIDMIRPFFSFPVNWIAMTGSILLAAFALHMCDGMIRRGINRIFRK